MDDTQVRDAQFRTEVRDWLEEQLSGPFAVGLYAAKLRGSMTLALRKRPVSMEQVDGTVWAPKNFDPDFRGPVAYREILKHSLNIPTINPDGAEVRRRTNEQNFDMNRDYFAMSQLETRGRIKTMLEWNPQVVVDLHEMGGESQYYFPPAAAPNTPNTTQAQRAFQSYVQRFPRGAAQIYATFDLGLGVGI